MQWLTHTLALHPGLSPCAHATHTQMVGLYQDPEGKTVFSRTDPSHANMPHTSDKGTIESLRRQVQELKNEVLVNHLMCKTSEQKIH